MNIQSLLDYLEAELQKGSSMPLTGKTLIDQDKCLDILEEIRRALPDAIKEADRIVEDKQRILIDAEKEAELLIQETHVHMKSLVNENEITQRAYQQSEELVGNAQRNAREIRLGASAYADDILSELEDYVKNQLVIVQQNRQELKRLSR